MSRPSHLEKTPRDPKVVEKAKSHLLHVKVCSYCRRSGTAGPNGRDPDGDLWCMDHIIPLGDCGEDDIRNMTKACWKCNQTKTDAIWATRLQGKHILTAGYVAKVAPQFIWTWERVRSDNPRFAELMDWKVDQEDRRKMARARKANTPTAQSRPTSKGRKRGAKPKKRTDSLQLTWKPVERIVSDDKKPNPKTAAMMEQLRNREAQKSVPAIEARAKAAQATLPVKSTNVEATNAARVAEIMALIGRMASPDPARITQALRTERPAVRRAVIKHLQRKQAA